MRNTRWLRFGITGLMVVSASMAGLLVACSDDETTPAPTPTEDGGSDSGTPAADSGGGGDDAATTDSGTDAGKAQAAKLTIINAITDLGPTANIDEATKFQAIRICFTVPSLGAPFAALPKDLQGGLPVPGIYIGTAGVAPDLGLASLAGFAIQPYLMNAATLAKKGIAVDKPCSDLLDPTWDAGDGPLVENDDYWKLPEIPAGTLADNKSFALVVSGCAGNAVVDVAESCGAGFTAGAAGVGTLKVAIHELDRSPVAADAIGTQFIYASPAAAAKLKVDGTPLPIIPGYIKNQETGEGFLPATDATDAGVPVLAAPTALKQVKGVTFGATGDKFTPNGTVNAPAIVPLARPLAEIEKLSGLTEGTYANGKSFTFVLIGDPAAPATVGDDGKTPNLRTIHFLGLANDPTIKAAP